MARLNIIKKLRAETGAGIQDIRQALEESGNDEQEALTWLRQKGQKISAKRGERQTKEGVVDGYVHANGKIASLVAVACETDFVARNADFKNFVHELALQVAATAPRYVAPHDVPPDVIEQEKKLYRAQFKGEKKPAAVIEKIIQGKLEKFYAETCLLKQPYIRDDSKTIEDLLNEMVAKIGERIKIVKFIYFTL